MIEVQRGDAPIILGLPHTGMDVPQNIRTKLNEKGQALSDTDWHIDRLYDGLLEGVTTVRTPVHRYVIDVNRGPDDANLYPGQNTTGLCPLTDFDGIPIYQEGQEPGAAEIEERRLAYHAPYHSALSTEIERLRGIHPNIILYDCHSIRSVIPFLFDGTLPEFNIGTNMSTSCAPDVENTVENICRSASSEGYRTVVNGRFKGGWTTRHYGAPSEGVHAIQMEIAQSTYMDEQPPWTWQPEKADQLRSHLSKILSALRDLVQSGGLV